MGTIERTMAPVEQEEPKSNTMKSQESSEEHVELQNFAYGLGSYSVAPETDKAEQGTRMEAELLMSLCSSPVRFDKVKVEAISASESESSYLSDSSGSRRDVFTFVCPSFSLENPEIAMHRVKHNEKVRRSTHGISEGEESKEGDVPAPALLLKRPLKVDDRDAYRLSTEAMARNLSRSMQKALDWRIQTWVHSLSLAIVKKEKTMLKEGVPEDEMRTSLLRTSEARLLTTLQNLKSHLQVTGAGTGFRVLPNQVEGSDEPMSKKRRLSNGSESQGEIYAVTHELTFDGIVNLDTPAGKSEVLLQIPGTIEGTFARSETRDMLQSVSLDVDTDLLVAMIEKSSRDLIRESVTKAMEEGLTAGNGGEISEPAQTQDPIESTPPTPEETTLFTSAAVRAALITPRMNSESPNADTHSTKFLLPIPDDLNDSTPSRISPQPNSPAFGCPITHFTPRTPKSDVTSAAAALVSPTLKEPTDYHEVPENSPSLPVLVEVACREFRSD